MEEENKEKKKEQEKKEKNKKKYTVVFACYAQLWDRTGYDFLER